MSRNTLNKQKTLKVVRNREYTHSHTYVPSIKKAHNLQPFLNAGDPQSKHANHLLTEIFHFSQKEGGHTGMKLHQSQMFDYTFPRAEGQCYTPKSNVSKDLNV